MEDPRILAGMSFSDDAAIFRINENTTIVQTVDFFPPVVDDPYEFGAIAVANSLSDIYAMGAVPLTALNIVAFNVSLDMSILTEILQGGIDKAKEAGVVILGGHSVRDKEIKYGLAVTGILTGESFTPNSRAKKDDLLVLTKPIGSGILTTGIKKGVVSTDIEKKVTEVMKMLNRSASEIMMKFSANSATDITGFGLIGHGGYMADSSGVSIVINSGNVPVIDGTYETLEKGAYPGGSCSNRKFVEPSTCWSEKVPEEIRKVLCDAQTSGGLLVSIDRNSADGMVEELIKAGCQGSTVIGEVIEKRDKSVIVR
jgi:selenide, water dikinase